MKLPKNSKLFQKRWDEGYEYGSKIRRMRKCAQSEFAGYQLSAGQSDSYFINGRMVYFGTWFGKYEDKGNDGHWVEVVGESEKTADITIDDILKVNPQKKNGLVAVQYDEKSENGAPKYQKHYCFVDKGKKRFNKFVPHNWVSEEQLMSVRKLENIEQKKIEDYNTTFLYEGAAILLDYWHIHRFDAITLAAENEAILKRAVRKMKLPWNSDLVYPLNDWPEKIVPKRKLKNATYTALEDASKEGKSGDYYSIRNIADRVDIDEEKYGELDTKDMKNLGLLDNFVKSGKIEQATMNISNDKIITGYRIKN